MLVDETRQTAIEALEYMRDTKPLYKHQRIDAALAELRQLVAARAEVDQLRAELETWRHGIPFEREVGGD